MTLRRVRSTNAARADLTEIWSFVARGNVVAADKALERILDGQSRLIDHPEAGSRRERFGHSVRVLVVDRYLIFYRVEPEMIVILRVFDGRRDIRPADLEGL